MTIPVPVLSPCLSGCEHTTDRIPELADRTLNGHVCTVTVALVESTDNTVPLAVQVVRLLDVDGTVHPPRVEVNSADGRPAGDVALTARSATALAKALTTAAEFATNTGGAR